LNSKTIGLSNNAFLLRLNRYFLQPSGIVNSTEGRNRQNGRGKRNTVQLFGSCQRSHQAVRQKFINGSICNTVLKEVTMFTYYFNVFCACLRDADQGIFGLL